VQFIDEVTIYVKAGDGGNGSTAMRREDGVPRGGPSGGDGGVGGSVILLASTSLSTLLDFKYKRHYRAERGEDGRNKDQYGAGGPDMVLRVPVGTVVYDEGTNEKLADLDTDGVHFVVAQGGNGGRGNIHFKNPWNQAPRTAEAGGIGVERMLRLELKLMADVGLLGYPNVGKSTFISAVSRARPKVADYPFTTLAPSLGVVRISDDRTFVVADIPGLIEGAADGAGLGLQFLRHVERCRVLLHIVEDTYTTGPERAPLQDFDIINRELKKYAPELAKKPQVVVLNKCDAITAKQITEHVAAFKKKNITLLQMSAATGDGVPAILEAIWKLIGNPEDPMFAAPVVAASAKPAAKAAKAAKPAAAKPAAKAAKAAKPAAKAAAKPAATVVKAATIKAAKAAAAKAAKAAAAKRAVGRKAKAAVAAVGARGRKAKPGSPTKPRAAKRADRKKREIERAKPKSRRAIKAAKDAKKATV
jgi:GTP-binding protein